MNSPLQKTKTAFLAESRKTRFCRIALLHFPVAGGFGLLRFAELVFANAAQGAYPVFGQSIKSGARLDSVIRIAYGGIVHITANVANILIHI